MASFNASSAVDMRSVGDDFAILGDDDTDYTFSAGAFTAKLNDVAIAGGGSFVTSPFFHGSIGSLTIKHHGVAAYTIFGTPLGDYVDLRADVHDYGGQVALAQLLDGGDLINGSASADWLLGFNGNDLFHGGGGKDRMDGGIGLDTADYSDRAKAVAVKLSSFDFAAVKIGGHVEDKITNIENVNGGSARDKLTGDDLNNVLHGNGGSDRLSGGDGADDLYGGLGNDRLKGGDGKDTFHFNTEPDGQHNVDTILDFHAEDRFAIHSDTFGYPFAYVFDQDPTSGSPTIIYKQASGNLFFDPDGNGDDDAIQLAHIEGNPHLSLANVVTWLDF